MSGLGDEGLLLASWCRQLAQGRRAGDGARRQNHCDSSSGVLKIVTCSDFAGGWVVRDDSGEIHAAGRRVRAPAAGSPSRLCARAAVVGSASSPL